MNLNIQNIQRTDSISPPPSVNPIGESGKLGSPELNFSSAKENNKENVSPVAPEIKPLVAKTALLATTDVKTNRSIFAAVGKVLAKPNQIIFSKTSNTLSATYSINSSLHIEKFRKEPGTDTYTRLSNPKIAPKTSEDWKKDLPLHLQQEKNVKKAFINQGIEIKDIGQIQAEKQVKDKPGSFLFRKNDNHIGFIVTICENNNTVSHLPFLLDPTTGKYHALQDSEKVNLMTLEQLKINLEPSIVNPS